MQADKFVTYEAFLSINEWQRSLHQKRILVHGVFDILHKGHVQLLVEAKKLGDLLMVGLEPDDNVRHLKGLSRPIHHQDARAYVLSFIEPIDYVFLLPSYQDVNDKNAFYRSLYKKIQPDIVATCLEEGPFSSNKKEHANTLGIPFVNIHSRYEKNTSKILELLAAQQK